MRRPSILIFDESRSIRDMIATTLADHYHFDVAVSAAHALAELRRDIHTACIVQIPPTAIPEHLRLLKHFHRQNPRRLLVALGDQRTANLPANCYEAGAHAFVPRSAQTMRELRYLLERLLALPGFTPHKWDYLDGSHLPLERFVFCKAVIDPTTMTIRFPSGGVSRITAKQAALLRLFSERAGQTVRRAEVLAQLWGQQAPTSKALDVQLMRLRKLFQQHKEILDLQARPKIGWYIPV